MISRLLAESVSAVSAVGSAWDRFWYQPRDPMILSAMRLFVGGMLFYTHLVWGFQLEAFLGAEGWNNASVVSQIQADWWAPSFWWYVPTNWMMSAHCLCLGILLLFWAGVATRVTSVLSLAITISYAYRAHMANFGLDQINAILCLYLCLGPSGARFSVDRLVRVWLWKRRSTKKDEQPPRVAPTASANLAIRLIQLHFCVIYFYAGFSKLQGMAWWSGEAVWLAFANREYQSVEMTWIAWYPWISEVMTHTTIIWEVSFAAAIWVRCLRPTVLLMGFGMHLGIGGMMGMWTFGLIMIFGHMAFWPEMTVHRLLGWLPSSERLLNLPETVRLPIRHQLAAASKLSDSEKAPLLLCVHRNVSRLMTCLNYFGNRGFRCLASRELNSVHTLRKRNQPEAVVLLGSGMKDDDVVNYQREHFATEDAEPLFLVLSDQQAERLNGQVAHGPSKVLTGQTSLRDLRHSIQQTLEARNLEARDADVRRDTEAAAPMAIGRP